MSQRPVVFLDTHYIFTTDRLKADRGIWIYPDFVQMLNPLAEAQRPPRIWLCGEHVGNYKTCQPIIKALWWAGSMLSITPRKIENAKGNWANCHKWEERIFSRLDLWKKRPNYAIVTGEPELYQKHGPHVVSVDFQGGMTAKVVDDIRIALLHDPVERV